MEELTRQAALAFARTKPGEWDYFLAKYLEQHPVAAEPATVDVTVESVTVEQTTEAQAEPEKTLKRKRSTS